MRSAHSELTCLLCDAEHAGFRIADTLSAFVSLAGHGGIERFKTHLHRIIIPEAALEVKGVNATRLALDRS